MTRNTVIVTDAAFDDDALRAGGISGPSTPTALVDETRVDAGLGAWPADAVLPGPGGAS
jgi:hypothetical protein